uniref:Uncharacterized protein n=1 Tax=Tanacetum cinerariifolium TaxID=118510 RepID=A0A6L2NX24_TANCI|nr:hypothetical protein [Tanacetum cinerariifolium]
MQSSQQWLLFSSGSGNFLYWKWELLLALLIDRLDHDVGPFSIQVIPSSFWQIDDSLRALICSVWAHFGDVRFEGLGLGEIKLFMVAFDSQLKVFYPHKNDNASGEHLQCYIHVEDDIFL